MVISYYTGVLVLRIIIFSLIVFSIAVLAHYALFESTLNEPR